MALDISERVKIIYGKDCLVRLDIKDLATKQTTVVVPIAKI
jgi:hypothetical protein